MLDAFMQVIVNGSILEALFKEWDKEKARAEMNMPLTAGNRRPGNTPPSTGGSWEGTGAPSTSNTGGDAS